MDELNTNDQTATLDETTVDVGAGSSGDTTDETTTGFADRETQTVTAAEVGDMSGVLGEAAPETETDEDVLETGGTELPPPIADAHRGKIDAVTTKTFESGTTGIFVDLTSIDNGTSAQYKIFPPAAFFDSKNWVEDEKGHIVFDKKKLAITLGTKANGEPQKQTDSQSFARSIQSSTASTTDEPHIKDAPVQRLRKIAKIAGRSTRGLAVPTNADEYIALLNSLCAGLEVIYTRVPDVQDGEQTGFLKVQQVLPTSALDDPKADQKYFKGKVKQWEVAGQQ